MSRNLPPRQPSTGLSFGRMLIYLTLFCIAAIIGYNYYKSNLADYTSTPQEVTLKYIPSDFNPNIDEENALAVLSNPRRYRQEFNDLVYQVNRQLIQHTSRRMGLSDSLINRVVKEYDRQHPFLRDLYYDDFVALKDTSSQLYQIWYDNEFSNAAALFNEVASKYTCFFLNQIYSTVLKTEEGKIYVKGKKVDTPCGLALNEALQPMIRRLQERAAIDDFSKSKEMLEQKVEKVIAELATMEVRDKKGLSRQMQTKLFGFPISSTDVEVSAISILKVGFKLDRYFNTSLDTKAGVVTVTLPEPEILSHEVYPKIDKLDIGWMREVKNVDLNKNFNSLRDAFRQEALESEIFDKSKKQVTELMEVMLAPLVKSLNKRYKLQIKFKKLETQPVYDDPAPLGKEPSEKNKQLFVE